MADFINFFQNAESLPLYLAISTLISEDLAFLYGLFSTQTAKLSHYNFVIFYTLGVLVGDIFLYGVGYMAAKFKNNKYIGKLYDFIVPKKKNTKDYSNDFGLFEEFLALTRFIPGSRIPTYTYCGFSSYPIVKFSMILLVTTIIYALVGIVLINIFVPANADLDYSWQKKLLASISSAFVAISIFKLATSFRKLKLKYKTMFNLFVIRITRLKDIEFWPSLYFYIPFVPYFVYLLIRYGGVKSLLAPNPSIKLSGLIGELKSDIDELLIKYAENHRLRTFKLPKQEEALIQKTIQDNHLAFPIILKPDNGMRGTGVEVVQSQEQCKDVIQNSEKELILQEYSPLKEEWGVFYYRYPGEDKGKVFSITRKVRPEVIGNGKNTLLELVLEVPIYRKRFDWIFENTDLSPQYIPQKGEFVRLVERGSHSKGCIFKDGSQYIETGILDKVKATIDKIEGFHIGRVDMQFENLETLKNGEFKIIEINGTGGESSNFYDPDFSKLQVYKILIKQWTLIFKIGHMNRKQGKSSQETVWTLFREIFKY